MRRPCAVGWLLPLTAALCLTGAARASGDSPDQQLADRYAPVVMLKKQDAPCGAGEPYRPTTVDLVLGNPEVTLRGPGRGDPIIEHGPTAADLYGLGDGYYLDLPGDPLRPDCTYEEQFRRWNAGRAPVVYAHLVQEAGVPDRLALQYWLYYTFNDFNDRHESDWEMIQLVFDASSAQAALETAPAEAVYSQHGGGETASWDAEKLEKQGTHPVVYAGSGSHANYYAPHLYLGRSSSEGFGCDDTRGPSVAVHPNAILLPTVPGGRDDRFAWLAFDGRWGQREAGANNGPTGVNTKTQWTQPITWMEDTGRDSSVVVPGRSLLGPSAAGFFCRSVARGSNLLNLTLHSPWLALGLGLLLFVAVTALNRRTRWVPVVPVPVRQARTVGQILRVAWRLHREHRGLCFRVGVVFLGVSLVVEGLQAVVLQLTPAHVFVEVAGEAGAASGLLALLIGGVGLAFAAVATTAAMAVFTAALGDGRLIGAREAFGLRGRARSVLANAAFIGVAAIGLSVTVVGIPVAVWLLVRWAISNQACVIDGLTAAQARGESARLVRGAWFRTLLFTALVNAVALLAGPLVGVAILLLLHDVGIWLVNVVGSLVYMVVYPFVGIAFALYLYDRKVREEGGEPVLTDRVGDRALGPSPQTT